MREKRLFNDSWLFLKSGLETTLSEIQDRKSEFHPVCLPHDWLIYDTLNLYEDSQGWYLKCYRFPEIMSDEHIMLNFDGVYMDCTVYLNGNKVGDWKYGYSTFTFELTSYIRPGDNEIMVQVRYQSPNSRWYTGAGIYRDVNLLVYPAAYIPEDGTYISTSPQGDSYELTAETEVVGGDKLSLYCQYTLWDKDDLIKDLGRGEGNNNFCQSLVRKVKNWEPDSPVCYTLKTELFNSAEELLDQQETTVGFKHLVYSPNEGFFLNGQKFKIQGVCDHHDLGCLGAAFNRSAARKRLELLKEMGVNGLRTSHNMPAKAVMELCDELGILVVSEAFDMWKRYKTKYDYSRFFAEWMEKDVKSWIRRDRNHPCLMFWSIGNEIYDTHIDEQGQETTRQLIAEVRTWDPRENAGVTIGSNYLPWENAQKCAELVKAVGYNYGEKYYAEHHQKYPDWIIYGSETCSIVQSRGVYHFPLNQPLLADDDEQCSALGNSVTSWGTRNLEACILEDLNNDYSGGQFIWSGFDYIGEPTPYHTKNSYLGQIDTAGYPKDAYYVFQSAWAGKSKKTMIHIFPYWDFNPGQLIDVRVCTTEPEAELFVNGISQGRKRVDLAAYGKLILDWQVAYQAGEIKAVAYDARGKETVSTTRHSFGDSAKIILKADKLTLKADGEDLLLVTVETRDYQNRPVENAMDYVQIEVTGAGVLMGLDNGDSTDYDQYKSTVRKLFNGKLRVVVGATAVPGTIKITAKGANLQEAYLEIESKKDQFRAGTGIRLNDECRVSNLADYPIPVRKVVITNPEGNNSRLVTPANNGLRLQARIFPKNATCKKLIWKAVNKKGIEIPFVKITPLELNGAELTASGNGEFYVRCLAFDQNNKVKIISQLEFQAEGFGEMLINPCEFVPAGLFKESQGELDNGNEKGIATARDGITEVTYHNLDFGSFGAKILTIWVFALTSEEYPIEVWLGKPEDKQGRLLETLRYQKPSRWNTYQPETFSLPERLRGVVTLTFRLRSKVHIKGFEFTAEAKAYTKLSTLECDYIYGDSYIATDKGYEEIGNNVTLVYEEMDFGQKGADGLTIWGRTPLAENAIHFHLTNEDGMRQSRMVTFICGETEQNFTFEPLKGSGKLEFVFLPGSTFDFYALEFKQS